ncbi:MAG TPA: prepilin-type N-terminal cleavage/methylation domain-containing protein [Longimicrobiales bacterium]|nr:prepilin-type N-terminal cleavage/methylation domain-containing protein [Longimicrobiales bacterium]
MSARPGNVTARLRPRSRGFTLIEVIGALVIFSGGVLMVLRITGSLSRQMDLAAVTSELVVRTQERIDSLEALPFDSLAAGTVADTFSIRGRAYTRSVSVTPVTGLLYRLDVRVAPADGGSPSYEATSYTSAQW